MNALSASGSWYGGGLAVMNFGQAKRKSSLYAAIASDSAVAAVAAGAVAIAGVVGSAGAADDPVVNGRLIFAIWSA